MFDRRNLSYSLVIYSKKKYTSTLQGEQMNLTKSEDQTFNSTNYEIFRVFVFKANLKSIKIFM